MNMGGPIPTRLTSFETAEPRNGEEGPLHPGLCDRPACTSKPRAPRIFKLLTDTWKEKTDRKGWKREEGTAPAFQGFVFNRGDADRNRRFMRNARCRERASAMRTGAAGRSSLRLLSSEGLPVLAATQSLRKRAAAHISA